MGSTNFHRIMLESKKQKLQQMGYCTCLEKTATISNNLYLKVLTSKRFSICISKSKTRSTS